MNHKQELLAVYDQYPFHMHPLWVNVCEGRLTLDEILSAEIQHFLRTRAGRELRGDAVVAARSTSRTLMAAIFDTFLEECDPSGARPTHLDLVARLLTIGGVSLEELESATPTPGNAAAIALYRDIAQRGPACHIIGAGVVEYFYSQLSPQIFAAYTSIYGMSDEQAETYRIHGSMDQVHAERAFSIIDEAVRLHGWSVVKLSVRDAFVATWLHYDGMYQAARPQSGLLGGLR